MFRQFSNQSIKRQLSLLAFLLIISFLVLYFYGFYKMVYYHYNTNINYMEDNIENFEESIKSQADELSKLIPNIIYNPITQKYLKEDNQVDRYNYFLDLDIIINNLQDLVPGIKQTVIISPNGNNYGLSYEYREEIEEFTESIPTLKNDWYSSVIELSINHNKTNTLLVGSNIYNIDHEATKMEILGQFVVILNIKEFIRSNSPNFDLYLIGKDSRMITSPNSDEVGKLFEFTNKTVLKPDNFSIFKIFSKNKKVIYRKIPEMDAYIAGIITERELFSDFISLLKTNSIIFIPLILIISGLYTLVVSNIIGTHNSIIEFIKSIKWEDFQKEKEPIEISGYSEAKLLGESLNRMIGKIGSLTKGLINANNELYELELTTKKAEMSYLINQINPHFLYNTLESIKGIAGNRGVPEIQEITQCLGGMFRYSLLNREKVSLEDEIKLIMNYLKIQKLRFSDRINFSINIPEKFLNNSIPKMILQPIIENAIFHGLELNPGGGDLTIGAKENSNKTLDIVISDTGLGIDSRRLAVVRKGLESYEEPESANIGLSNVHKRVRLTYGEEFGISISSIKDRGTTVVIHLPVMEVEDV